MKFGPSVTVMVLAGAMALPCVSRAQDAAAEVSPWRKAYDAGWAAIEAGDYEGALELLAQAEDMGVSKDRGKSPAANGQGWAMLMARKYGDAVLHFERSLEQNSENKAARGNLGFTHLQMYELSLSGKEALDKAIDVLSPMGAEAPSTLAKARELKAREDRWASAGNAPSEPTGGSWRALADEGDAAEENGWFDFAVTCYGKAEGISHSPKSKGSAANRAGYALMKARRFEEALSPLQRAVSTSPDTKVFWKNLGLTHKSLYMAAAAGDHLQKAQDAFQKAAEIDPEYYPENLQWTQKRLALEPKPAKVEEPVKTDDSKESKKKKKKKKD